MSYVSKVRIDDVDYDIKDVDAIHDDELISDLSTALVDSTIKAIILDLVYPVGSYYMSDVNTSPASILGGTWDSVRGRFLYGESEAKPAGTTGGNVNAVVVQHSHTLVDAETSNSGLHDHEVNGYTSSTNEHSHSMGARFLDSGTGSATVFSTVQGKARSLSTERAEAHRHSINLSTDIKGTHSHTVTGETNVVGTSGVDANLPPYKTVYIWVRTA